MARGLSMILVLNRLNMTDALVARPKGIKDKRDAVAWALILSMDYNGCSRAGCVNLDDAQLIYDFITKNVNLPEVEKDEMSGAMSDMVKDLGTMVRQITEVPVAE